MGEYRREIIGTAGSVLGIGFLSTQDSGDVAGPIIVDGSEGGPALEVKEAYLLDNGNKTATFTQYAGEPYEVEGVLQNIGDEAGSRTFDLVVGESVEDERVVELSPAESQTVYFMPNAPSVSEQTTLSVMLGESAVGELVVEPRVDISVTGAFLLDGSGNKVDARTLTEGEILDAVAELENAGIDSGEISLALELEGSQLDSATATVGPDAGVVEQQLSGEVPQVDQSTEYAATIADQSAGTVTVEPAPAIPDSGLLHDYNALKLSFNDGEEVTTFTDQQGSADGSAVGSPTYSASGINGNPSVIYGGADDGHDAPGMNISNDTVAFLVTEPTDDGTIQEPLQSQGDNEETAIWRFDQSNDEYRIGWDDGFEEAGSVSENPEIQTYIWDATNGNVQVRANSTSVIDSSATLASLSIDGFYIGYRGSVSDRFINAPIGRLLIYNLSDLRADSSITEVESALADEWGISI